MADAAGSAGRPPKGAGAAAPKKPRRAPRPRHVPQRTCAACRQVRPKRELLRIVRTQDGHVVLDPTGKKSGRGTYLCARRSCWDLALKKGRLEQALSVTLLDEDRVELAAYRETLPPENDPAPTPKRRKQNAGQSTEADRPA